MKSIRKLIPILAILMGLWVMASFVGVMLNVSNADFWTTSLMWSLLASLLVMPALVMMHHATYEMPTTQEQPSGVASSVQNQPPFVPEEEEEGMLWPDSEEEKEEAASSETYASQK